MEGILISDLITEDQRLQELMEIPVPFVAMHSECLAPEQRIGMDNAAAAADMTRYLLKNGHRKILVAAGSEGSMEQADRMIGVLSAMGQENLSLQEEDILDWGQGEAGEDATITGEEQQAYRKMKEYLSHYGTGHHTAVLCFSDYLAFGIKRAIREAGYRIPEDFSLTGFGDSSIGEYMEPALTTVEWDPLDCGYAAAKLLHERMRQKKDTEKSFIPYRIAGRDSVMDRTNA